MEKRILTETPSAASVLLDAEEWIDLESVADVEVSSEEGAFPVENALLPSGEGGWRASESGMQLIRLRFVNPVALRRIRLLFVEEALPRTQEFTLRWAAKPGALREIVRQQFNFSPPHTTRELEEYEVELKDVSALELAIIPDVSGGSALASLREMRLA
jgi:hypothetical protein